MANLLPEPNAVTLPVIDVLEQLEIDYVVVGSLASSQHGTARSTFDSDLVVELTESDVPELISRLKGAFFADPTMALDAIKHQSSFNLIHLETMFKVDLIISVPNKTWYGRCYKPSIDVTSAAVHVYRWAGLSS